jgi:hypothetical protein
MTEVDIAPNFGAELKVEQFVESARLSHTADLHVSRMALSPLMLGYVELRPLTSADT